MSFDDHRLQDFQDLQLSLQCIILQVRLPEEWERVVELSLGVRPSEPPSKHIFIEIMGRYSNVFLTNADRGVLACAFQVSQFRL
jgi:predicted ribosome quality control (RQC) complex YloA/Tae2 family protein